jgi:hypothetical protein
MADRDRQIDEAVAREAIRDLVARYNSYSDSGRFEPLFGLFAPDAVMETGDLGGEFTRYDGLEEITRIFTGAQDRVRSRPDSESPAYIRHFTATHQIDLIDTDHATGRLYFAVLMTHGLDHWGRYIDRYVRFDGGWKFAHRKVYVDGGVAESWFAGPGAARQDAGN